VATAAGVECDPTRRTRIVAVEVRPGRQRRPTDAAQDRGFVEPVTGPRLGVVVGGLDVAGVTRIKCPTTTEPEGDDITLRAPVRTPGLGADRDAAERDLESTVSSGFVGRTLFAAAIDAHRQ
jgi:hypothetical protein